jgi:hypothetical protein
MKTFELNQIVKLASGRVGVITELLNGGEVGVFTDRHITITVAASECRETKSAPTTPKPCLLHTVQSLWRNFNA